jgi:hypothetical protein
MAVIFSESETKALSARPQSDSRQALIGIWLALSLLYCALVHVQMHRQLWFDELLTFFIARAPTLAQVMALVERWDLSPPLYHFLAHISLNLSHGNIFSTRLPSIAAFYFASAFLYVYSSRKLSPPFAALPIVFLWYSPLFRYAVEARPYALICCFFCALLLLRDFAISGLWASRPDPSARTHSDESLQRTKGIANRRLTILLLIALSSSGLLLSHVLAVLSLAPFAIAEFLRYRESGKADLPLWLSLFLPLGLVVTYLPFFRSYGTITDYPSAFQATIAKVAAYYLHTAWDIAPVFLVALLVCWLAKRADPDRHLLRWPRSEQYFLLTLAVIPILLDLLMMFDHAPFWGRYGITSALILYFLAALFLVRITSGVRQAGYLAVLVSVALLWIFRFAVPEYRVSRDSSPPNAQALAQVRSELPLVAASGLTFVEMGQYESPKLSARLYYLLDRAAAVRYAHATLFEDLKDFSECFHLPGTVESYAQFVRDHQSFLVYGSIDYPEDWLLRRLLAEHASVTPLGVFPGPYKDKTLFQVHLNQKASERAPLTKNELLQTPSKS